MDPTCQLHNLQLKISTTIVLCVNIGLFMTAKHHCTGSFYDCWWGGPQSTLVSTRLNCLIWRREALSVWHSDPLKDASSQAASRIRPLSQNTACVTHSYNVSTHTNSHTDKTINTNKCHHPQSVSLRYAYTHKHKFKVSHTHRDTHSGGLNVVILIIVQTAKMTAVNAWMTEWTEWPHSLIH